jgi:hypothetical protein
VRTTTKGQSVSAIAEVNALITRYINQVPIHQPYINEVPTLAASQSRKRAES